MLLLFLILLTMSATGCGVHADHKNEEDCEFPPESFTWNHKTFVLKKIGDREPEPGKKWGYLSCDNGEFEVQSEGPNATYNLYTYGSSYDELLLFGKWGRALYAHEKN